MEDDTRVKFSGEVHLFADKFPMIPEPELVMLADGIKQIGLLHPLVLDPTGCLLDGRNRLAACERAGIEPEFIVFDGDPLALILNENVNKRDLKPSQKAAARAKVLFAQGKRVVGSNGRPRWKRGSGDNLDTRLASGEQALLSKCGLLGDLDPGLLDDVIGGASLDTTLGEAQDAAAKTQRERDQITTLTEKASDLMDLITEERMKLDEAWAAYLKRTEEARKLAAADLEDRISEATTVVKSLRYLGGAQARGWRDRVRERYDPENVTGINPEEFTPQEMRAVGKGLIEWAREWEKK